MTSWENGPTEVGMSARRGAALSAAPMGGHHLRRLGKRPTRRTEYAATLATAQPVKSSAAMAA